MYNAYSLYTESIYKCKHFKNINYTFINDLMDLKKENIYILNYEF